jgi:pimeloyl-ACP methyl ester carboxylesterase
MSFVDVGGTLLHTVRDGTAGPWVLVTQGLGGAWFDWDPVVPLLAGDVRLIRFDRPGLGWSQPEPKAGPPAAQSAAGEARRMLDLLAALGVPEADRVVLVAHSYGGFHAEAFARLYPERTAGVVFVDSSVEPEITPKPGGPARPLAHAVVRGARVLGMPQFAGPGLRRLIIRMASETRQDPDPELGRAVYRSSRVAAATVNELISYRPVAVELLELRCEREFPRVPVRVLVGAAGVGGGQWVARQRDFAGLFAGAEVVELRDAKHLIAADRPDAVAAAVRTTAF